MTNRWTIWGGIAAVAAVGSFFLVPQVKGWARGEIETVIHQYIVENPEVIPEAMTRLEERRMAQMIGVVREDLERPFEGAWSGATDPQVTVVQFFDYACGYCRASLPDLNRLVEENDDVRIVYRELPILSPESEQAARVSLSAARQREYMDFHLAMYAAGRPSNATIAQAQREAGLDAAQVTSDMNAENVVGELRNNLDLARRLELTGTPAFIIGDRILSGAVGYERLRQAVQEVRDAPRSGD
ncbi:DsbA family protein [Parasphingopyxis marina]|uniref:DsbA family protein n=1 Tax=Parasphingopyxis marina TaxID=2761622 RepID=A0A842HWL6_9SPHN|nr:DsbA family protein [Parasphingopyxis marina]MBC2778508.1 DsbA family protein [Parasphingopyxis marina]